MIPERTIADIHKSAAQDVMAALTAACNNSPERAAHILSSCEVPYPALMVAIGLLSEVLQENAELVGVELDTVLEHWGLWFARSYQ